MGGSLYPGTQGGRHLLKAGAQLEAGMKAAVFELAVWRKESPSTQGLLEPSTAGTCLLLLGSSG